LSKNVHAETSVFGRIADRVGAVIASASAAIAAVVVGGAVALA